MRMANMVLLHESKNLDGDTVWMGAYGPHLLMDCHGCDVKKFNRKSIEMYMKELCAAIEMDAEDFHFWDDTNVPENEKQTEEHAVGTSVGGVIKKKVGVQFVITSSIVIHTLDLLGRAYIDIFSCKLFSESAARCVTRYFFKADWIGSHLIQRN